MTQAKRERWETAGRAGIRGTCEQAPGLRRLVECVLVRAPARKTGTPPQAKTGLPVKDRRQSFEVSNAAPAPCPRRGGAGEGVTMNHGDYRAVYQDGRSRIELVSGDVRHEVLDLGKQSGGEFAARIARLLNMGRYLSTEALESGDYIISHRDNTK